MTDLFHYDKLHNSTAGGGQSRTNAPSLLSHKYLNIKSRKDVRPAFVLRYLLKQLVLHPFVVVVF